MTMIRPAGPASCITLSEISLSLFTVLNQLWPFSPTGLTAKDRSAGPSAPAGWIVDPSRFCDLEVFNFSPKAFQVMKNAIAGPFNFTWSTDKRASQITGVNNDHIIVIDREGWAPDGTKGRRSR
ncbi:hypothetical protein BDQ94DRAFT_153323 [Aspergillus welwitschiae]|uniref:Uncharacterized protein n=1 Tax=Aspergillus welwitschiae TaxID=1341132 RepID=A0A3F3PL66_9EURO|nr:hypothetical protein BDQ94DRAFT_153323 [Aspergillus welwitschiae]RDH27675.1 hypothetical protein BDQ94DRAFT_153323 [Aspergillus welwitschiae]